MSTEYKINVVENDLVRLDYQFDAVKMTVSDLAQEAAHLREQLTKREAELSELRDECRELQLRNNDLILQMKMYNNDDKKQPADDGPF